MPTAEKKERTITGDEALRRYVENPSPASEPVRDERLRSCEVTGDHIIFHLMDGRLLSVPIAWSWRLMEATEEERQNFEVGTYVVHWPDVDEDLSVQGALRGAPAPRPGSRTTSPEAPDWPPARVKRLRMNLGLTQSELAEQMGVRQATVSDWENGYIEPSPMARRLLAALGRT